MGPKQLAVIGGGIAILALMFFLYTTSSFSALPNPLAQDNTACTREAKVCPDGSTVGREGPNCEFAACPNTDATSTPPTVAPGTSVTVEARVGQEVEALGETILVRKVVEDSRCPQDVQCVWAGTLRIDMIIRGGMGDGQLTLELGKEGTSEVNAFKLVDARPSPRSGVSISESDYIFTFEVTRR